MRQLLFLLLSFCFLFGCDKDEFLVDSFIDCESSSTNFDEFRNKLLGDWQLKEITCGLCSGDFPRKTEGDVRLTFKTDNSFIVEENSKTLELGKWEVLTNEFGSNISVEVEDGYPEYLPGTIGLCKNQLFADLTYLDQLGYLYVRID